MAERSESSKGPEGRKLGRFRLIRELGRGNFGRVWLAREEGQHGFSRRVALKVLQRINDQKRWRALIREARICGHLNHPNIVAVHGVERVGRIYFIIMEHVEGETLRDLWLSLAALDLRFPREVVIELGIAIAEALHHGWTHRTDTGEPIRIVHRDLKPANVLVSNRGIPKVGDFGLAVVGDEAQSPANHRVTGTPSYMAPEVWAGGMEPAPRTDLWALGIILWELTVGRRFYKGTSLARIPSVIVSRTHEEEAEEVAQYFPELAPLVGLLLRRPPDDRPGSAIEVAEELRGIRASIGAAGDLLQFLRLVRAGRLPSSQRDGSLGILPTIPRGAAEWIPLLDLVDAPAREPTPRSLRADAFTVDYQPPEEIINRLRGDVSGERLTVPRGRAADIEDDGDPAETL